MRLALGSEVFKDLDWRAALGSLRTHGYRALDLQVDSDSALTASIERDGIGAVGEHMARLDLAPVCVSNVRDAELLLGPHSRHTDATCPGGAAEKIAHAVRWSERTIAWAERLGCPLVRLYFGCPDHLLMFPWHGYQGTWDANVRGFVAAVTPVLDRAAARGITVCVETHPRQALFRLDALEQARSLLADGGHRLGLCFDPANVAAGGLDPVSYLETLPEVPEIVHAKDVEIWRLSTAPPGDGWRRYGPGPLSRFRDFRRGEVHWDQIGASLRARGFDGAIVTELEDPTTSAAVSLAESTEAIGQWARTLRR